MVTVEIEDALDPSVFAVEMEEHILQRTGLEAVEQASRIEAVSPVGIERQAGWHDPDRAEQQRVAIRIGGRRRAENDMVLSPALAALVVTGRGIRARDSDRHDRA